MNGIQSSIGGLTSALRRISNTAHNIANSQTKGYQSVDANTGTIRSDQSQPAPLPGVELPSTGTESLPPSDVNLTTEVTTLIINKNAFEANISAIKAQDETLGSILDIVE